MSAITISNIEPSDVLGGAMFAVGVAVFFEVGTPNVPSGVGIALMILGMGAVFGSRKFVELLGMLLSNDGSSDGDGTGGDDGTGDGDGDDESDDGEVGIDRPPRDKVEPGT